MHKNRIFYFNFSLSLFFIAFVGFGVNGFVNPDKLPPKNLLVHTHALFMFSWLAIIPLQVYMSQIKKPIIKNLQKLSLGIAVGIIVTIFFMTASKYQRVPNVLIDVTFNLLSIVNFMVLIGIFIRQELSSFNRYRMLLLASLIIILPGLKRLLRIFSFDENIAFLLLLFLFIIFAINEIKNEKKIHKFTILSAYLIIQSVVLTVLLIRFEFWENTINQLLSYIEIA